MKETEKDYIQHIKSKHTQKETYIYMKETEKDYIQHIKSKHAQKETDT